MRSRGKAQRFPIWRWAIEVETLRSRAISQFWQCSKKEYSTKEHKYQEKEKKEEFETPQLRLSWPKTNTSASELSFTSVSALQEEFLLQRVEDIFTDEDGTAMHAFSRSLMKLDTASPKGTLSVESYLTRCKKIWFDVRYLERSGHSPGQKQQSLLRLCIDFLRSRNDNISSQLYSVAPSENEERLAIKDKPISASPLGQILLYKLGDWPVYTLLLALVMSI